MRVPSKRASATILALVLAGGALLVSGCNRKDPEPNPTPPKVVVGQPREVIEMMPSTSDEAIRRHFFDSNGFEYETHIEYKNKDKAIIKMRPDNTRAEYERRNRTGTVVTHHVFAADGQTIVRGHELRDDGTLRLKVDQDSRGVRTTLTYWYDGKTLFSQRTQKPTGEYDEVFHYKDGKKWSTRSGSTGSSDVKETVYRRDGSVEFKREKKGTKITVTAYRSDGTASYRQHLTENSSQWGGSWSYNVLTSVEEFAADGRTVVREFDMSSDGYSVEKVTRHNDDGTSTVRTIDWYGNVEHEDKLDADGNVTSSKDFTPSDNVRETYDRSMVREVQSPDPPSQWSMQERYPSMRNRP